MDLLLGLDVGTTGTKAMLVNIEGRTVASAAYSYGLKTPREDWVEQDPEDLWRGVVATARRVMDHVNPQDRILALSISAQGGTTIPVDASYRPVCNAISWMDHRAREQAEQLRESVGEDKIYETGGWQLYDGLPLLHVLWLRRRAPEVFASARYFLFVNDFIVYRLTGQLFMDPSDAGITQLYNISKGCWDEDMRGIAGIESSQLSPVRSSGFAIGNLTSEASEETGLPRSVLVVNGAHDQYCAALGAGVLKPGDVMLSCGTAWVILGVMDQLGADAPSFLLKLFQSLRLDPEKRLSISPHVIPNKWGALKSMGAVGASMEWFLNKIWTRRDRQTDLYEELNECAGKVPAGSRGLLFFPSSGGYGHGSRGAFIGLAISHSQDDMARAIMEGIAFDLRWTLEDVREAGIKSDELRMVGGAAASPIWTRIVADVTHLPVALPSTTQTASFGAAILAGVGSGVFSSPEEGYRKLSEAESADHPVILEPVEENCKRYDELFEIHRTASQQVHHSLYKLSRFESKQNAQLL